MHPDWRVVCYRLNNIVMVLYFTSKIHTFFSCITYILAKVLIKTPLIGKNNSMLFCHFKTNKNSVPYGLKSMPQKSPTLNLLSS
jgi:hypothetical protein